MRYQLRYIRGCKSPLAGAFVRDTGIEPVTSSVSGKRATAALIAPMKAIKFSRGGDGIRTRVNGFAGRCLASRPRHHAGFEPAYLTRNGSCTRADDETRTRDPHLGKVMRYQLRYIRNTHPRPSGRALGIHYPESRGRPNQPTHPGVSAGRPERHPRRTAAFEPRAHILYYRFLCRRARQSLHGRLAQLVSALPSHGRGRGFESRIAHHIPSPVDSPLRRDRVIRRIARRALWSTRRR